MLRQQIQRDLTTLLLVLEISSKQDNANWHTVICLRLIETGTFAVL